MEQINEVIEKINVAYATDFAGECMSVEGMYDTLCRISAAGFSHIHWCHEWDGDYTYSRYEMLQIHSWMNELGLKCKGIHATEGSRRQIDIPNPFQYRYIHQNRRDYTSENEYNRMAGVELIKNRIELANILGTDSIVLHMQLPYKSFEEEEGIKEKYYGQVYKSFDELEVFSREKNVRICMENLIGTPNSYQIEQFDKLFSRYESEFLGFCFDTGHGMLTGEDPLVLARRYQDRLYMMHVNDNHGLKTENCDQSANEIRKVDEHRNPFQGKINWEEYAKIVAGSPYELPIVLEVSRREADAEAFLRESIDAGKRLTDMIKVYQK